MSKPWAFIAHKDGVWHGLSSAERPRAAVKKFFSDFAGYSILTVHSQEEYLSELAKMKPRRKSPTPKQQTPAASFLTEMEG